MNYFIEIMAYKNGKTWLLQKDIQCIVLRSGRFDPKRWLLSVKGPRTDLLHSDALHLPEAFQVDSKA